MPRKKFEGQEFDSFATELARDAERAARPGRVPVVETGATAVAELPPPVAPSSAAATVVELKRPPLDAAGEEPATAVAVAPPVVEPLEETPLAPARPAKASLVKGPTKRYVVSYEEDRTLKQFVQELCEAAETTVSLGLLNRAMNTVAMSVTQSIKEELRRHPVGPQPSTNDAVGYADYEQRWADTLDRAIRRKRVG